MATNDAGTKIFVGAPGTSSRTGVANVFEVDPSGGTSWYPLGPIPSSPASFVTAVSADGNIVASMSTDGVRVFTLNVDVSTTYSPTVSHAPSMSPVPTATTTTNLAIRYWQFVDSLLEFIESYLPPPSSIDAGSWFELLLSSLDLSWLVYLALLILVLTALSGGSLLVGSATILTGIFGVSTAGVVVSVLFWFFLWPFGNFLPGPFCRERTCV